MRLLPESRVIETEEQAQHLLNQLMEQEYVAVDTETTGLSRWKARVVCWSVSFFEYGQHGGANRYVIPVRLLSFFAPFFAAEHVSKVFHNAQYDMCMLWNSGIQEIAGRIYCTLVLGKLIDENRSGAHGLKECAWDFLGLYMRSYKDIINQANEELAEQYDETELAHIMSIKSIPERSVYFPLHGIFGDYASEDAWATIVLFTEVFAPAAKADVLGKRRGELYTVWDLYNQHFSRYIRTLASMCRRGWRIDLDYLRWLIPSLEEDIRRLDLEFNKAATLWAHVNAEPLYTYQTLKGKKDPKMAPVFPGGYINPGSDNQLRYFFFEVMGYPVISETEGGNSGVKRAAVGVSVMKKLYNEHGCNFASLILERRRITKTLSTYLKGYEKQADLNGKIHASLVIMGAVTGRLACRDPNLQNVPRPDNDHYGLRKAFIADPGHILVVADYSQLEMNILAHMSECPDLCNAINSGRDLHCWTAEMMFGEYTYDELKYAKDNLHNMDLSKEERDELVPIVAQRTAAKAIGFGIMYGRGAASIAEQLNLMRLYRLSYREAAAMGQEYIDRYLSAYPGVGVYIDKVLQYCQARENVQTWLLRKRRLISINSSHDSKRADATRQALNSIIQGTAADIAMVAMNKCESDPYLKDRGCTMLMQVHDELIFQCPEELGAECEARIVHNMEAPFVRHFRVPIKVSSDRAYNWADAK